MRDGTRNRKTIVIIALLLFTLIAMISVNGSAFAATIVIPKGTKLIEEQAFYGVLMDEIVLPDEIEEIRSKAFVGCGLKKVRLPDQLEIIAVDAFDEEVVFEVEAGTPAYEWVVQHGKNLQDSGGWV